ncbi:hypothetical protein FA15DRAFT_79629 [Coprinopsis marcescibilis]|uniref:Uncharacterized protein n=1 Tax=Coprinopsis marcescibilis TaxID=230819 RepID=A0A5C3KN80_COPMA|nr:hypothetical protein FA15DRAFT_79629 [Coprinopsis marcescibilis]
MQAISALLSGSPLDRERCLSFNFGRKVPYLLWFFGGIAVGKSLASGGVGLSPHTLRWQLGLAIPKIVLRRVVERWPFIDFWPGPDSFSRVVRDTPSTNDLQQVVEHERLHEDTDDTSPAVYADLQTREAPQTVQQSTQVSSPFTPTLLIRAPRPAPPSPEYNILPEDTNNMYLRVSLETEYETPRQPPCHRLRIEIGDKTDRTDLPDHLWPITDMESALAASRISQLYPPSLSLHLELTCHSSVKKTKDSYLGLCFVVAMLSSRHKDLCAGVESLKITLPQTFKASDYPTIPELGPPPPTMEGLLPNLLEFHWDAPSLPGRVPLFPVMPPPPELCDFITVYRAYLLEQHEIKEKYRRSMSTVTQIRGELHQLVDPDTLGRRYQQAMNVGGTSVGDLEKELRDRLQNLQQRGRAAMEGPECSLVSMFGVAQRCGGNESIRNSFLRSLPLDRLRLLRIPNAHISLTEMAYIQEQGRQLLMTEVNSKP